MNFTDDPAPADATRRAWLRKKDYDRAIADLSKAIELDPRNADAYAARGSAYGVKRDLDHVRRAGPRGPALGIFCF